MSNQKWPVSHGIVVNWDIFEKLLNHVFDNVLKIKPENHVFLTTEAPLNPKANRERITKLFFETYKVQSFYVAIKAVLSLYQ